MKKYGITGLLLLLVWALAVPHLSLAASGDKTTKYRVYQYDQALMEFTDYNPALWYARGYSNSRVEEIGSGKWLWNNYPRYQIYQYDISLPEWRFTELEDAVEEASRWGHAVIRDLQGIGWVWNNYPRYQVYQGDYTQDNWGFVKKEAALAEAKRWANSHIIDLNDNRWIWDNLSSATKKVKRSGSLAYQVYQGNYTQDSWRYAYLEDAIQEALRWSNSLIIRMDDQLVVYDNRKKYHVYQENRKLEEFVGIDQAADYARQYSNATIRLDGRTIWSNEPTYYVYRNNKADQGFYTIPEALEYAKSYPNASLRNQDGMSIWNNHRKLRIWGWNGSASMDTIMKQTSSAMGLDVDSPSWFQLSDAEGGLKDTSSKDTSDWLKKQGLEVHPLVHNQFNSTLTTSFLSNPEAKTRFIKSLVDRAVELQAHGINLDFENISSKDRTAYTDFVAELSQAAHTAKLKLSIDLPRGSVKWNHLGAYDHERLAELADYIITMTYDQHYAGSSTAGSAAGLQWVEEGIKEFLSYGIPREKLIMGIPFYVREWTLNEEGALAATRALYSKDLPGLIAARNGVATWDPKFNQYKVEYTAEDNTRRIFWLEDQDTVKARLAIAKKYELVGAAAWRLGQEHPDFWKVVLQNK